LRVFYHLDRQGFILCDCPFQCSLDELLQSSREI
jgi:hypothetical protein